MLSAVFTSIGSATYPDAAWSPRPRDPPVTTTTFPFKEKIDGKSLRTVSAAAILICANQRRWLEELKKIAFNFAKDINK